MNPLEKALVFLFLLATIVIVHEFGHFIAAKLFRVKVLTFSVGFGPRLFGFTWGETEYRVAALPLGGFVRMAGDDPDTPLPEEDRGRGFLEQRPWKRAVIAGAGPLMNLIFPILVYFIAFSMEGTDYAPLVSAVSPDQPAYAAGLRPGDRITAVEGRPVRYFTELQEAIGPRWEKETAITYQRGGRELTTTVTPLKLETKTLFGTETRGLIGISANARAPLIGVPSQASPAARAGLQTFDRIVRVGDRKVASYPELAAALAAQEGPVEVTVVRDEAPGGAAGALTTWNTLTARIDPLPQAEDGLDFGIESIDLYFFTVDEGTPAWEAGIRRGDRLLAADGRDMYSFTTFEQLRHQKGEAPLKVAFLHQGERVEREISQRQEVKLDQFDNKHEVLVFGARDDRRASSFAELEKVPFQLPLGTALVRAASVVPQEIGQTLQGLWMLVTGKLGAKNLGGPIAIYHVAVQSAEAGSRAFLKLMGFISINLGLLNLMPIPMLDGFHIFTAGVETVRRRPLSTNTRIILSYIGLALLVLLMVFAFRNDFINFILK